LNFCDLFHRSGGSNARSSSGSPSPRRSVQVRTLFACCCVFLYWVNLDLFRRADGGGVGCV
jgi:hypothetical protein